MHKYTIILTTGSFPKEKKQKRNFTTLNVYTNWWVYFDIRNVKIQKKKIHLFRIGQICMFLGQNPKFEKHPS